MYWTSAFFFFFCELVQLNHKKEPIQSFQRPNSLPLFSRIEGIKRIFQIWWLSCLFEVFYFGNRLCHVVFFLICPKSILLRILLYRSIELQHVCELVQLNHKKESVESVKVLIHWFFWELESEQWFLRENLHLIFEVKLLIIPVYLRLFFM